MFDNKKYQREWYLKNKENHKQQGKKYYLEHKTEVLKRVKTNHKKKIDEYKSYSKHYRDTHKEEIKNYYLTHKNEINAQYRKRYKEVLKNNIVFKLKQNLRRRLRFALKDNWKSGNIIELLGCSVEFLKKHLELQFKDGMRWDNYGEWEIDHIHPLASFDLSKKSEQFKVCYYTNLQPLWQDENRKKWYH